MSSPGLSYIKEAYPRVEPSQAGGAGQHWDSSRRTNVCMHTHTHLGAQAWGRPPQVLLHWTRGKWETGQHGKLQTLGTFDAEQQCVCHYEKS